MSGMSIIVKISSRIIAPILLLIGVYVSMHGHITLGGGFSGGVIIAISFLLIIYAFGIKTTPRFSVMERLSKERSVIIMGLSALMLVILKLVFPIKIYASELLSSLGLNLKGVPGELFSAYDVVLFNIIEATHVAVAFLIIFYCLMGPEES